MSRELARRMAGEIALSERPGETLRKWRDIFQLSQKHLAGLLDVNPSVICDFEKGRRASPGIGTVKRIVEAMVDFDRTHGSRVINTMSDARLDEALIALHEFSRGVPAEELVAGFNGEVLTGQDELKRHLYGYTVVDSLKAITSFSGADFGQMYGWSNERALFFTGVQFGRSPMIAIRAHQVKPRLVCYIRPANVDALAPKLAAMERIILVTTTLPEQRVLRHLQELEP